jgi:DNA-binding transcriptional MerR regulator
MTKHPGRWDIAAVARLSGVSSRTLRHYDAIGLLPPSDTASDGRRLYEHRGLLRLQQILLLRELGLSLDQIRTSLDDAGSEGGSLASLRRRAAELAVERRRLAVLADTIDQTIDKIEKGEAMPVEKMFTGFENDPYEQEARERWGDAAVDASYEKVRHFTPDQAAHAKDGFPVVHAELAALRASGAAPSDQAVQRVIAEHFALVSLFWTPSAEAYRGLGQMYVEDERFRTNIGSADPTDGDALVTFLRDAMDVHAAERLEDRGA